MTLLPIFKKEKPGFKYRTIAFDGPERVGKSTQIKLLKKLLEKKGKKVLVLHSSLLEGRDVTKMKLSRDVKNLTYIPALWDALMKANKFLEKEPKGVVIFDRHIASHLVFSMRYNVSNRPLAQLNTEFTWLCHEQLHSFCNVVMTGHRWDGSAVDAPLDDLFIHFVKEAPFKIFHVGSDGRGKQEIFEEVKKGLGV